MSINIPRFKNGSRTVIISASDGSSARTVYVGDLLKLDSGRILFSPYPDGEKMGLSSFRADNVNEVRRVLISMKKS